MKTTKQSVLIETTNTEGGMLEQGGGCGRVVAYPLADTMTATGLSREELSDADADDRAPAYADGVTIRQACEREMTGRIVRCGVVIE